MSDQFGVDRGEAARQRTARSLAGLSQKFLAAVKRREDPDEYRETLAELDDTTLMAPADDADAARAFWVNCYNAFVQDVLRTNPAVYEDKREFFGSARFTVAGTSLSLDDIEHGILRSSKWKYGLGYVPR